MWKSSKAFHVAGKRQQKQGDWPTDRPTVGQRVRATVCCCLFSLSTCTLVGWVGGCHTSTKAEFIIIWCASLCKTTAVKWQACQVIRVSNFALKFKTNAAQIIRILESDSLYIGSLPLVKVPFLWRNFRNSVVGEKRKTRSKASRPFL